MKPVKLSVEYEFDFEILGIISPVKDYKLALHINRCLDISLKRDEDINLEFLKEGKIVISCFLSESEYSCLRLLKNKSVEHSNVAKPYLIPELKEYDYFIHLSGEGDMWDADETVSKLREIPIIQYIQKLNTSNLKSRENLIF
ncbi:IPExxxVDY family protein [Cytophagaceae bacterium ABcell3]|nr:IPExxxVDY family protein [Cytophagaceae bacterium ABcell3]